MSATHDKNGRPVVQPKIVAMLRPGLAYATAGIALALGVPRHSARQALDRLTEKGLIARRKVGIDCVYFHSQACADAWSAAEAAEFAKEQKAKRAAAIAASSRRLEQQLARADNAAKRAAVAAARERGAQDAPAPVSIGPRAAWRDAPADLSRAVITRAKAPVDARFHVDPGNIEAGAFVLHDMPPRWSDYAVRTRP